MRLQRSSRIDAALTAADGLLAAGGFLCDPRPAPAYGGAWGGRSCEPCYRDGFIVGHAKRLLHYLTAEPDLRRSADDDRGLSAAGEPAVHACDPVQGRPLERRTQPATHGKRPGRSGS